MSHSLNEQSRITNIVEPVDDDFSYGAQAWILDTLEEVLGLERDTDRVYFDSDKTMGLRYNHNNSTYGYVYAFSGVSDSIVSAGNSINSSTKLEIYWHKSTNENVTFVEIHIDNSSLWVIAAKNTNGDMTMISINLSNSVYNVSNSALSNTSKIGSSKLFSDAKSFSISKVPDPWFNDVFPELYFLLSYPTYTERNHLVSFNGSVYRLIYHPYNTSISLGFAFPVSDSTTP